MIHNVTKEMEEAGMRFASDCVDAQFCILRNGLDRGTLDKGWGYLDGLKDQDLLIAYLKEEITSVVGIYLAMERAK